MNQNICYSSIFGKRELVLLLRKVRKLMAKTAEYYVTSHKPNR